MDEALGWAQRFIDPFGVEVEDGYNVELRPMFERADDLAPVHAPIARAEERLREQIGQQA